MTVEVEKSLEAQLSGYVGRGVLSARVNEEGHLILTMTAAEKANSAQAAANKAQQIAIPSANFTRTDEYAAPWADPETPHKEAGNAKDTAFCILTVDRNTATVYADHYGAGYSREVNVSKEEKPAYTNVLPKAASAWGGTDVYGEDYNGDGAKDGYKTGMRLNSSVQEVAVSGMCLTGIIHIQPGDVVRIKNITLSGSQTAYMGTFSSSGAAGTTAISILGSPDAAGVYTWTNTAGYSAFRLSVGLIDGNSIVTVNEEIV